jgi:hypothetical protein
MRKCEELLNNGVSATGKKLDGVKQLLDGVVFDDEKCEELTSLYIYFIQVEF